MKASALALSFLIFAALNFDHTIAQSDEELEIIDNVLEDVVNEIQDIDNEEQQEIEAEPQKATDIVYFVNWDSSQDSSCEIV
jgi:hypothetical protein